MVNKNSKVSAAMTLPAHGLEKNQVVSLDLTLINRGPIPG